MSLEHWADWGRVANSLGAAIRVHGPLTNSWWGRGSSNVFKVRPRTTRIMLEIVAAQTCFLFRLYHHILRQKTSKTLQLLVWLKVLAGTTGESWWVRGPLPNLRSSSGRRRSLSVGREPEAVTVEAEKLKKRKNRWTTNKHPHVGRMLVRCW